MKKAEKSTAVNARERALLRSNRSLRGRITVLSKQINIDVVDRRRYKAVIQGLEQALEAAQAQSKTDVAAMHSISGARDQLARDLEAKEYALELANAELKALRFKATPSGGSNIVDAISDGKVVKISDLTAAEQRTPRSNYTRPFGA